MNEDIHCQTQILYFSVYSFLVLNLRYKTSKTLHRNDRISGIQHLCFFVFTVTERLLFIIKLLLKCRKKWYHSAWKQNLHQNQWLQLFQMFANFL